MRPEDNFVHIDASCWDFSINGEHWTGKLVGYLKGVYTHVELEHPLSQKEATYLNKKDQARGLKFCYRYQSGSMSEKFETKEQLQRRAVEVYKIHFPDATVLIYGGSAVCDPRPILDGPEPFKTKVNKMWEKWEKIGGYEGDEKKCDRLFHAYQKLIKETFK